MGDLGSIPGLGRSPGEGKGYPLQYSGLENPTDYTYTWRKPACKRHSSSGNSLAVQWGCKEWDMTERLSFSFFGLALVQLHHFSCHSIFSIDILFGVSTHSDICLYLFFSFLKLNLAVLGLPCCGGFSLVAEGGSLVAVCGLLVVAPLVAEHGLQGTHASVIVAPGLLSTGSMVVAHRLSCITACGIFPAQRANLCLLHW